MAGTKFDLGTAVERGDAPGAFRAHIGEEWNCPIVPHGGLVTATTLRAMIAELDDPGQTLRSVTTVFAAQVQAGPVDIDVNVLRRGRSVSQVQRDRANAGRRRRPRDRSRCSAARVTASRSPTRRHPSSRHRTTARRFATRYPKGWCGTCT